MKFLCAQTILIATGLMSASLVQATPYSVPAVTDGQAPVRLLKVGDRLVSPPPDPAGTAVPEPQGQALREQVLANLKRRFTAAADPSTHLLTQAAAKQAGLGYIADHFHDIDRSGGGYVSFDDLERYLRQKNGPAFAGS
ncbi:hypothetical protein [Paraburkholderia dilworthii]|uniref:EF-hand domain-containing protein n=1 Tax=Paraburkholderia dilworthii TaxID=948106 RepID=A0ABW9DDA3_9BURK